MLITACVAAASPLSPLPDASLPSLPLPLLLVVPKMFGEEEEEGPEAREADNAVVSCRWMATRKDSRAKKMTER